MESNELLPEVFKAAQMAMSVTRKLILHCSYDEFRSRLTELYTEYYHIAREAEELILEEGEGSKRPWRIGFAPVGAAMHLRLKADKSISHMAEMIMHSSLIGLIDIARCENENPKADEDSSRIAQKFMDVETKNITAMKAFL